MAVAEKVAAKIEDVSLAEVDEALYRKLRRANMGWRGSMQTYLGIHEGSEKARAIIAYDDEGVIASWALLFPSYVGSGKIAYFWARATHRRQGYATLLAAHVRRRYRNVKVCPWDKRSSAFFKTQSFKVADGYKFE